MTLRELGLIKKFILPKTEICRLSDSPGPISLTAAQERFCCDSNPIFVKVRFSDLSSKIVSPLQFVSILLVELTQLPQKTLFTSSYCSEVIIKKRNILVTLSVTPF